MHKTIKMFKTFEQFFEALYLGGWASGCHVHRQVLHELILSNNQVRTFKRVGFLSGFELNEKLGKRTVEPGGGIDGVVGHDGAVWLTVQTVCGAWVVVFYMG